MEMNAFARLFADRLFQAFPEWRGLSRVDSEGYLIVEVPPPSGSQVAGALCVSTADDEVTVFVDAYHDHFSWPIDEGVASSYEDPITFIREILAETLVVVSWWNDGEWRGSTAQPASETVKPWDGREATTHARVRSWNGTFDREVHAAAPR